MAKPRIVVTGIEAIDRRLRRLEPALAKKVLRQSMRTALKPVKEVTARNAPRRSGALVRAIKLKAARRSRTGLGLDVVIGDENFKGLTYYGAMVEFGTERQQAQHYMERAFKSTGEHARGAAIAMIREGIEQTIKGL